VLEVVRGERIDTESFKRSDGVLPALLIRGPPCLFDIAGCAQRGCERRSRLDRIMLEAEAIAAAREVAHRIFHAAFAQHAA
jgi:hypothetical protein